MAEHVPQEDDERRRRPPRALSTGLTVKVSVFARPAVTPEPTRFWCFVIRYHLRDALATLVLEVGSHRYGRSTVQRPRHFLAVTRLDPLSSTWMVPIPRIARMTSFTRRRGRRA